MKNDKGYTLIELIISIAVLMIILVPFYNMFLFSSKVNALGRQELDAVSAGKMYLEEIKLSDEVMDIEDEEIVEYRGYDLAIDIEKIDEYVIESEDSDNTLVDEDLNIEIFNHADIKASAEDFFIVYYSSDVKIVLNEKGELLVNGDYVLKDKKNNLNIVVEFNQVTGNYLFEVENYSGNTLSLYIKEPDSKNYTCDIYVITGKVNIFKNIKDLTIKREDLCYLYKVAIDVSRDDKHITTLEGTKKLIQ